MTVNINEYVSAHGKTPRGYGNWMFKFNGQTDDTFCFTGLYSAAKSAALSKAANLMKAGRSVSVTLCS